MRRHTATPAKCLRPRVTLCHPIEINRANASSVSGQPTASLPPYIVVTKTFFLGDTHNNPKSAYRRGFDSFRGAEESPTAPRQHHSSQRRHLLCSSLSWKKVRAPASSQTHNGSGQHIQNKVNLDLMNSIVTIKSPVRWMPLLCVVLMVVIPVDKLGRPYGEPEIIRSVQSRGLVHVGDSKVYKTWHNNHVILGFLNYLWKY